MKIIKMFIFSFILIATILSRGNAQSDLPSDSRESDSSSAVHETHTWSNWFSPWIGPAIVASLVSMISQWILFRRQGKKEKEKEESSALAQVVAPVAEAADDIVARLFDVIVRKKNFGFSTFTFPSEVTEEILREPPQVLTTVFRFARYFASVSYLQRRVSECNEIKKVRVADFYASNKVRMGFKANVSDAQNKLPTESQQFIGSKFLNLSPSGKPDDFDFYTFLTKTPNDKEAEWAIMAIARFLSFNPDFTKMEPQQIAVALVLVYMIDFYQDLYNNSKWEEFRVFLTSFLRSWNKSQAKRAIYLYKPDDLSGDDYLDTFPLLQLMDETTRQRNKRIQSRQTRGRMVSTTGVVRERANAKLDFKYSQNPGDLLHTLTSLM